MRAEVLSLLDGFAIEGAQAQTVGKLTSSGQDCQGFANYLTANELTDLRGCSMWEGCQVVSKRLKLLGISGMKESLKNTILGILVWHEQHQALRPELFRMFPGCTSSQHTQSRQGLLTLEGLRLCSLSMYSANAQVL